MLDIAWGESKSCIVFQVGNLSISRTYNTALFNHLFHPNNKDHYMKNCRPLCICVFVCVCALGNKSM